MVIFTDICVFHFSIFVSWSSEMQFGVIYLNTLSSKQTYFAFSTFEFHSCLFCFRQHTWHCILLHCISQCLLGLMSSLFSWLTDGACLPCSAVHTLSVDRCILMLGSYVCFNPVGHPCKPEDYRYSRLTVCIVSSLCEVCARNIICVISVPVTLSWNVFIFRWLSITVQF